MYHRFAKKILSCVRHFKQCSKFLCYKIFLNPSQSHFKSNAINLQWDKINATLARISYHYNETVLRTKCKGHVRKSQMNSKETSSFPARYHQPKSKELICNYYENLPMQYKKPRGGTQKFSVYIGEADFFGVKILNFRIFWGFQKN